MHISPVVTLYCNLKLFMRTQTKTAEEQGGTIGFSADPKSWECFTDLADKLDVSKSELARTAYSLGLSAAVEKMREAKIRKAQTTVSKLSGLLPQALYEPASLLKSFHLQVC